MLVRGKDSKVIKKMKSIICNLSARAYILCCITLEVCLSEALQSSHLESSCPALILVQTLIIDNKKARAQNGDILSENYIPCAFSKALTATMEKMNTAAAALAAAISAPCTEATAPVLVPATAAADGDTVQDTNASGSSNGPTSCKL